MKTKTLAIVAGALLALILLAGACSAGFVAGNAFSGSDNSLIAEMGILPNAESTPAAPVSGEGTATPEDLQGLFRPFWQAWDLVNELYVDQPVDQVVLMRGAIKGMLESLGDEHTSYLDPKMFEESNAHLQGEEYEGIGAWVDITQDYLTIISPMPGSPAEKAGLKPGDKVVEIDGEDMTGKDGEYARQHVLGPKGSIVRLKILREGVDELIEVEVQRAAIVVPQVAGKMLENDIAYVQLYTFGDETAPGLKKALKELMAQNPKGLILDLRNNGGGYLNTAIDVVSQFVGDGVVMYEEYGDGRRDAFEAKRGGLATDIPLVLLVNGGSASASEIVAGAIQDRQRGYLVGEKSFGKGSVQNYVELVDKQGAVRVTIARWLTPNGRQINQVGLQPDFPVEISQEDVLAGRDTQLEQAIAVLTQGLLPPPTPIPSPTPTTTPVP
jgi:carboxyl-terminal processing protease